DVGVVLQGAMRNLLPYATPIDNVRFPQRGARKLARGRDDATDAGLLLEPGEVLGLVGLGDHAHTSLPALSPGQRQRLAGGVARAAVRVLLVLAQPTSQLDHEGRDEVLAAVSDINRDLGTTVVAVTHDPDVAQRLPRTVNIRARRGGGPSRAWRHRGGPGGSGGPPRRGLRGGRPGRLADPAAGRAGARPTR